MLQPTVHELHPTRRYHAQERHPGDHTGWLHLLPLQGGEHWLVICWLTLHLYCTALQCLAPLALKQAVPAPTQFRHTHHNSVTPSPPLQGNGALECVNRTCPSIDYCPEELRYTPEGVCCPTCKVPVCNAQQEERAMNVTVDNGCRECSCKVSEEV